MRTIAQRELRNDISRVLGEVEAGETVQVTVRGRVVAELGPPRRRELTPASSVRRLLAMPSDESWLGELTRQRRADEDHEPDPWA